MANRLTFRMGDKVRYVKTHCNVWGDPIKTDNEVVTVVGRVRDETGCFCSPAAYGAMVKVRDAKGCEFEVETDDCEAYNTMWDLTHEELMELRGQVRLGSLFLSDYDNNFGIDPAQVCSFCEGFGESIDWDDAEDTPDAFADYCEGVERQAA